MIKTLLRCAESKFINNGNPKGLIMVAMAVLLKKYSLPAIPVIIIILMVMIPVSANGTVLFFSDGDA